MSRINVENIRHPDAGADSVSLDLNGNVNIDSGTLYVDAGNDRVGIGTASPVRTLHVQGDARVGPSGGQYILFAGGSTNSIISRDGVSGTSGNALSFSTGTGATAESMRIDSDGRLLVGTLSPITTDTTFESTVLSGSNKAWINSEDLNDGDDCYIAARGEVNNNNRVCRIGSIKIAGNTNACGYIFMDEEDGNNAYFWTDNSGNFRISSSSSNIGTTGGTVVGTQTSDERVKNILGPVEYGLETLKQIEPVRFSLKSQPDIEQIGFIAQQVQPLVPQSVFDTKEHIEGEPEDAPTKLGMEYVALIPVLVNAIKEMATKIETLEAKVAALEAQ